MALLLFGLKDWSLGDFDDANTLFEAYLAGKPPAPYEWITRLRTGCPAVRARLRALCAAARQAQGPGVDPQELRAEFTKARNELQTTGKMVETFFAIEADLDKDVPEAGRRHPTPHADGGKDRRGPDARSRPTRASPPRRVLSPSPTPAAAAGPSAATTPNGVRWQTTRESYRQQVGLIPFRGGAGRARAGDLHRPGLRAGARPRAGARQKHGGVQGDAHRGHQPAQRLSRNR